MMGSLLYKFEYQEGVTFWLRFPLLFPITQSGDMPSKNIMKSYDQAVDSVFTGILYACVGLCKAVVFVGEMVAINRSSNSKDEDQADNFEYVKPRDISLSLFKALTIKRRMINT